MSFKKLDPHPYNGLYFMLKDDYLMAKSIKMKIQKNLHTLLDKPKSLNFLEAIYLYIYISIINNLCFMSKIRKNDTLINSYHFQFIYYLLFIFTFNFNSCQSLIYFCIS